MFETSFLPAIALTASGMHGCRASHGYIYDRIGKKQADVFNFRSGMMSVQSKSVANIGRSTEFGGSVRYCSNSSFYCLSAPMSFYNLIVPRTAAEGTWSFHGSTCITKASGQRRLAGKCDNGLSYLYERGRGIIRYSWTYEGDESTFALRGACGLFSEH